MQVNYHLIIELLKNLRMKVNLSESVLIACIDVGNT
jgi:hypothetical protein